MAHGWSEVLGEAQDLMHGQHAPCADGCGWSGHQPAQDQPGDTAPCSTPGKKGRQPTTNKSPLYSVTSIQLPTAPWLRGSGEGNGSISKVLKIDLHHFPLIM